MGIPMHCRLTATYEIKPQTPLRVTRSSTDPLSYVTHIGTYSVEIVLIRNGGASTESSDEPYKTRLAPIVRIAVSGTEDSMPPDLPMTEKGGKDYSARTEWFRHRSGKCHETATTVANRLIRFFKYQLHAANLREFTVRELETSLLSWTDQDGRRVDPVPVGVEPLVIIGVGDPTVGEKDFSTHDKEPERALESDIAVETYDEFMSEAQRSIIRHKWPRAVIEMAIACEIATRQAFFAKATPAGAAFEYLEDKGRIPVKVIDLLHGAARQAFDKSFKDAQPETYQKIDFLFRCRNKVVHRGDQFYRDDKGISHPIKRETLESWWIATAEVIEWLEAYRD